MPQSIAHGVLRHTHEALRGVFSASRRVRFASSVPALAARVAQGEERNVRRGSRGSKGISDVRNSSAIHAPHVEALLAAYPTFNLNSGRNEKLDLFDRRVPLGPQPGDEAILTLSGGVDSSVAAFLALERGRLVPSATIFMRNWNSLEEQQGFAPGAGGSEGCMWMRDWERVQKMAAWLGVKAELVDLSAEYWNSVFSPSLDVWSAGMTPNPDVMCNTQIKFGKLLQRFDAQERLKPREPQPSFGRRQTQKWLVTGHYADVEYYQSGQQSHGRLKRALDATKDQSYFLSGVGAAQLGRSHFPLAKTTKVQVRAIARALGMPTAESEESMGLCFVGERHKRSDAQVATKEGLQVAAETTSLPKQARGRTAEHAGFAGFLGEYIDARPGPIVTDKGEQIGKHNGLHTLTIGQRARLGGATHKYFVAAKDAESNAILVVPGSDHPWLLCHSLQVDEFHLIGKEEVEGAMIVESATGTQQQHPPISLSAQIRHRSAATPCSAQWISQRDDVSQNAAHADKRMLYVTFHEPTSSVAEGQVCAIYANDQQCLGSGVISRVYTAMPSDQSWVPKASL